MTKNSSSWNRKFGHSKITSWQYFGVCFLAVCAMGSLVAIAYSPIAGLVGGLATFSLVLRKLIP